MSLTPEQIADGWIAHDGSACPVDGRRNVRVMLGNGQTTKTPYNAGGWRWTQDTPPHPYDIIAYRPEQQP